MFRAIAFVLAMILALSSPVLAAGKGGGGNGGSQNATGQSSTQQATTSQSNIIKTKHDTVKNNISNMH